MSTTRDLRLAVSRPESPTARKDWPASQLMASGRQLSATRVLDRRLDNKNSRKAPAKDIIDYVSSMDGAIILLALVRFWTSPRHPLTSTHGLPKAPYTLQFVVFTSSIYYACSTSTASFRGTQDLHPTCSRDLTYISVPGTAKNTLFLVDQ